MVKGHLIGCIVYMLVSLLLLTSQSNIAGVGLGGGGGGLFSFKLFVVAIFQDCGKLSSSKPNNEQRRNTSKFPFLNTTRSIQTIPCCFVIRVSQE